MKPHDEGLMTTYGNTFHNIVNLHNVDDVQAWLKDANNIYVGRFVVGFDTDFKWGNPYRIKTYKSRKKVVELYEKYIGKNRLLLDSVGELKGKVLGCWCAPLHCHAVVLHRLAGNPPPGTKMTETTPAMEASELDDVDQKVRNTLSYMDSMLERISADISDSQLPIPADAGTPSLLSLSTIETKNVYETLLDSRDSLEKDLHGSQTSSSSRSSSLERCSDSQLILERLEMKRRLKVWRQMHNASLPPSSALLSVSQKTLPGRKIHSAPSSPTRKPRERSSSVPDESLTVADTPLPFSYPSPSNSPSNPNSSLNHLENQVITDGTRRILEFLASKVDQLAVSVNTIQYNLLKISETFQITLDDKIKGTDSKLEKAFDAKLLCLQNRFDNYKLSVNKDFEAIKAENLSLKVNLENYISEESEREEQIKECFNYSHHACSADYLPLKEDMEKKISELEACLRDFIRENDDSPHQRTRLGSFSEECRDDSSPDHTPPVRSSHDDTFSDEEIHADFNDPNSAEFSTIDKKLYQMAKIIDARIMELDVRVLECEQYSRRECLVISGVPAAIEGRDLQPTVIDILDKLGIEIAGKDISAIHRLGKSKDSRYPARVIVKFVNRKILDICHERKDRLPNLQKELRMNIRFFDSLAQLNQESLRLCNWLKENGLIHDHFLRNGFCKIVVAENDTPIKVPHPALLRDKFDIPKDV